MLNNVCISSFVVPSSQRAAQGGWKPFDMNAVFDAKNKTNQWEAVNDALEIIVKLCLGEQAIVIKSFAKCFMVRKSCETMRVQACLNSETNPGFNDALDGVFAHQRIPKGWQVFSCDFVVWQGWKTEAFARLFHAGQQRVHDSVSSSICKMWAGIEKISARYLGGRHLLALTGWSSRPLAMMVGTIVNATKSRAMRHLHRRELLTTDVICDCHRAFTIELENMKLNFCA